MTNITSTDVTLEVHGATVVAKHEDSQSTAPADADK